jgi:hypothetical protein
MYNKDNVTGLISCMAFERNETCPSFKKKNPPRRLPPILIGQQKGSNKRWGVHGD